MRALADPNLLVMPGAIYGMLGPDGAGKTTTLRILTWLDSPTGGTVTGRDSLGGLSAGELVLVLPSSLYVVEYMHTSSHFSSLGYLLVGSAVALAVALLILRSERLGERTIVTSEAASAIGGEPP